MSAVEASIAGVAVLGLAIWLRGSFRSSPSDWLLGFGLGIASCAACFVFFSSIRTEWLGAIILGAFLLAILPFRIAWKSLLGRGLIAALAISIVGAVILEQKIVSAGNALLVIEPYRLGESGWALKKVLPARSEAHLRQGGEHGIEPLRRRMEGGVHGGAHG